MKQDNRQIPELPEPEESTILGAILFLRFGYAVGHVGFIGVLGIIILGHLITFPTALAISEIATNQKVQGGGAYYIISRSFPISSIASMTSGRRVPSGSP